MAAAKKTSDLKLNALQRRLKYTFKDEAKLKRALTHRSASAKNNERLEFFGDSVLGFVIAEMLFHEESKADEGRLTRIRAALVREETLAAIARELDLGPELIMGSGEYRSGGFNRDSILADAFEALLAAIYLDSDMATAKAWLLARMGDRIEQAIATPVHKDPKTRLQERMQSQGLSLPVYEMLGAVGQAHAQTFEVSCTIQSPPVTLAAKGMSRRKAEQAAAQAVLDQMDSMND